MRKLTREEFDRRMRAVQNAWLIFGELTDNSIDKAFRVYREILASEQIPEALNTSDHGHVLPHQFDDYESPFCPDCGREMTFRKLPPNEQNIKTQLVCSNSDCDLVLNSEHGFDWWRTQLNKREPDKK